MPSRHAARPRVARHARRPESHRVARGIALAVTAALGFGFAGTAAAYTRLQTNIESVDVTALLGDDRPTPTATPDPDDPAAGQPLNILLIGSDVREGENADIGGEVEGMRSDTTIVMHVSADRSRVELVSIPRDTLVDIPACMRSDGTTSRPQRGQFNAAFSIGSESGEVSDAAVCTIRTVEENTGVFIHDYVVIDFAGFIRMVDALGGVPMCIPNDMRSAKAGLDLTAGTHVLDGATALAFARARTGEGLGDGSDIGRLGRQQELLGATVQTVQSKNLLTDVPELLRFLNAATSSITVSPDLASIPDMSGLAFSLRGTLSGNIAFMTIPIAAAPSDPNRVVMTADAEQVWSNISADLPALTRPEPAAPTDGPADPAQPTPADEPTPGQDAITADDVSTACA
ncbi:LCP family protein [uncultured Cellulomonas sp.]|uniref:LCP family protein n=1 Tax=uncultured Cellulomonas sp. TaxID=189682 RepID=UPI00260D5789|nr:LCP family protein [uncultured Cellulomonas sp.]